MAVALSYWKSDLAAFSGFAVRGRYVRHQCKRIFSDWSADDIASGTIASWPRMAVSAGSGFPRGLRHFPASNMTRNLRHGAAIVGSPYFIC